MGIESLFRGPRRPVPAASCPAEPPLADDPRTALLDDVEALGLGWFWATDAAGRLTYLSERAAAQLETAPAELLGMPLPSLFVADEDDEGGRSARPLPFLLTSRSAFSEMIVRVKAGRGEAWWQVAGRPKTGEDGAFAGYRGTARDVTGGHVRRKQAARHAQLDALTGLATRHQMRKRLDAILTAYRISERACTLMVLDLDRFEQVNASLGHAVGDAVLRQVAERLRQILDPHNGEIARSAGDEFQIVLPDAEDAEVVEPLAQRIVEAIARPVVVAEQCAVIGASLGVAIAPYDGKGTEELTANAALALYAAKRAGGGQATFYSAELSELAEQRRAIEEDLAAAIANDELHLAYQPIFRAGDHAVTGFEALMRWDHPERGAICPAVFIPVAEETGLIRQLGEWALRRACRDAAAWPDGLAVAVNVSAVQFAGEDFAVVVAAALAAAGLDPARLELEIGEQVFAGDAQAAARMFGALKAIGVRLALDDFGTGSSSLVDLRQAPFDRLKLDRSFVAGCTEAGSTVPAVVEATIGLAHALGLATTAEGVETADELAVMRRSGVTHVQGFVYGAAMTAETVAARLKDGSLGGDPVVPRPKPVRLTVFGRPKPSARRSPPPATDAQISSG